MNIFSKLTCALLFVSSMLYASDNAVETVTARDTALKNALSAYNAKQTSENRQKVIAVINGLFDFQTMGQKVLPKAIWEKNDKEKRDSFIYEFKRMIELSSVERLGSFQSDSTIYDSTGVENSKATVTAKMWYKGKKATLQYKLIKTNNEWKACDLIIDDLSTVRNYREQFSTILENKTLSDLTQILKKKADTYK